MQQLDSKLLTDSMFLNVSIFTVHRMIDSSLFIPEYWHRLNKNGGMGGLLTKLLYICHANFGIVSWGDENSSAFPGNDSMFYHGIMGYLSLRASTSTGDQVVYKRREHPTNRVRGSKNHRSCDLRFKLIGYLFCVKLSILKCCVVLKICTTFILLWQVNLRGLKTRG